MLCLACATVAGGGIGAFRTRFTDRELALLADRVLGTNKVLVTACSLPPE
ncbi:MAG: hypothetical protein H0V89_10960, partial [Deltaproteobacteria bacterium]|nr:hypothetical protein [Deltaproteobacteria bacterium]